MARILESEGKAIEAKTERAESGNYTKAVIGGNAETARAELKTVAKKGVDAAKADPLYKRIPPGLRTDAIKQALLDVVASYTSKQPDSEQAINLSHMHETAITEAVLKL